MNFKNELKSNNSDLRAILDSVNALPEAGAVVGVETCTLQVTSSFLQQIIYVKKDSSGNISYATVQDDGQGEITVEDCACNSFFVVIKDVNQDYSADNVMRIYWSDTVMVFGVQADPGELAYVSFGGLEM